MQRVECGAAINTLVNLNELAGESPSLECASHVERVGRRSAPWAEAGARLVRASANAPGRMRPAGAGARPGRVSMLWAPVRILAWAFGHYHANNFLAQPVSYRNSI